MLKPSVIWIAGRPVPKMRQRTLKSGHSYDPQEHLKRGVQQALLYQWREHCRQVVHKPIPLRIEFEFCFLPPESWSKKKRIEAIMAGFHTVKPDLSNLVKFYEDVMNDVVFEDDSQIMELVAKKRYAEQDGTKIQIRII